MSTSDNSKEKLDSNNNSNTILSDTYTSQEEISDNNNLLLDEENNNSNRSNMNKNHEIVDDIIDILNENGNNSINGKIKVDTSDCDNNKNDINYSSIPNSPSVSNSVTDSPSQSQKKRVPFDGDVRDSDKKERDRESIERQKAMLLAMSAELSELPGLNAKLATSSWTSSGPNSGTPVESVVGQGNRSKLGSSDVDDLDLGSPYSLSDGGGLRSALNTSGLDGSSTYSTYSRDSNQPKKITELIHILRARHYAMPDEDGAQHEKYNRNSNDEWEDDEDNGYIILSLTEEEFFEFEEENTSRIIEERKRAAMRQHMTNAAKPPSVPDKDSAIRGNSDSKNDEDDPSVADTTPTVTSVARSGMTVESTAVEAESEIYCDTDYDSRSFSDGPLPIPPTTSTGLAPSVVTAENGEKNPGIAATVIKRSGSGDSSSDDSFMSANVGGSKDGQPQSKQSEDMFNSSPSLSAESLRVLQDEIVASGDSSSASRTQSKDSNSAAALLGSIFTKTFTGQPVPGTPCSTAATDGGTIVGGGTTPWNISAAPSISESDPSNQLADEVVSPVIEPQDNIEPNTNNVKKQSHNIDGVEVDLSAGEFGAAVNGNKDSQPHASRRQSVGERRRTEIMGQRKFMGVDGLHCYFNLKVIFEPFRTGFEENKDLQHPKGTIIAGRYEVADVLGTAAFSTALQCLDLAAEENESEWVCLKVIKNNKDFFDQSLDEIKLLQYINSHGDPDKHNVLQLIDFFYYKEHLFIVSELLKENLYEFGRFIKESNNYKYYTIPRLKKIMKQILEALVFIHNLKLIHCDIKPENIVIKSFSKCIVKLIDFGSSCFTTDHLTTYIQSRSYRAPEVILGLNYDSRIDIWSVGAVLAELYTGYVLFQNDSVATMLARIVGIMGQFPEKVLRKGRETSKYFSLSNIVYERDEEGAFQLVFPKKTNIYSRLHMPPKKRKKQGLTMQDELFVDFIRQLLHLDHEKRLTAEEALQHPWMADADSVYVSEYIIGQRPDDASSEEESCSDDDDNYDMDDYGDEDYPSIVTGSTGFTSNTVQTGHTSTAAQAQSSTYPPLPPDDYEKNLNKKQIQRGLSAVSTAVLVGGDSASIDDEIDEDNSIVKGINDNRSVGPSETENISVSANADDQTNISYLEEESLRARSGSSGPHDGGVATRDRNNSFAQSGEYLIKMAQAAANAVGSDDDDDDDCHD